MVKNQTENNLDNKIALANNNIDIFSAERSDGLIDGININTIQDFNQENGTGYVVQINTTKFLYFEKNDYFVDFSTMLSQFGVYLSKFEAGSTIGLDGMGSPVIVDTGLAAEATSLKNLVQTLKDKLP